MYMVIEKSLIYKLLLIFFINPYNKSFAKKIVDKGVFIFKESSIYKKIDRYFDKKPYFLNSLFYKIFRKIIKGIDKIVDFFNKIIKKCFYGSKVISEGQYIKKFETTEKFLLISILIGAFNVGYSIASIFIFKINLYVSIILFILSIVFYLFSKNKNCFRESLVYKFFRSW